MSPKKKECVINIFRFTFSLCVHVNSLRERSTGRMPFRSRVAEDTLKARLGQGVWVSSPFHSFKLINK